VDILAGRVSLKQGCHLLRGENACLHNVLSEEPRNRLYAWMVGEPLSYSSLWAVVSYVQTLTSPIKFPKREPQSQFLFSRPGKVPLLKYNLVDGDEEVAPSGCKSQEVEKEEGAASNLLLFSSVLHEQY
jgi:hypothetical protein